MADLIDRQALMQDIGESVVFTSRPDMPSAELRGANKITDRIKAAPTIDPESLRKKGEWISVKARLPEYDQVVLCYKDGRGVRIGKHMPATYADGVVAFKDLVRDYAFGATHWMPLPEPPNADMRGERE